MGWIVAGLRKLQRMDDQTTPSGSPERCCDESWTLTSRENRHDKVQAMKKKKKKKNVRHPLILLNENINQAS
jgi:hypothetical protein